MKIFSALLCGLACILAAPPTEAQSAARERIPDERPLPQQIETPEMREIRERKELRRRERELAAREQAQQQEAARLAKVEADLRQREELRAAEAAVIVDRPADDSSGIARLWNLALAFKTHILIALLAIAALAFFWRDERRETQP